MDFRFTLGEEAFRQEVRQFLNEHLSPDWDGSMHEHLEDNDDFWALARAFTRRLARQGWVCPHWPKQYGGAGLTVMEQLIFNEETAYHRAPKINVNGLSMIGPILIQFGTDEQKQRYLAGMPRGKSSGARDTPSLGLARTWRRSRRGRSPGDSGVRIAGPALSGSVE